MKYELTKYNVHLLISALIVVPTSVLYGFKPDTPFELFPKTTDEFNFYKAIMGLYLGFSLLWIYSIVQPKFLQTALITNMFFMLGLALGRIISVFIDGIPTFGYQIGIVGELLLGFYSFWALRKIKW